MILDPTHVLLVPVGLLIAIAYTSTGISGANFWVPVFALWLRLDPRVAFWLALVVMLFGSSSGLVRHARQRSVDGRLAGKLLWASVPAAIAGAVLQPHVSARGLGISFGIFAVLYGLVLIRGMLAGEPALRTDERGDLPVAGLGGIAVGLISVGLGALLLPRLIRRPDAHATAVGTTLLAVFLSSLAAVAVRLRGELLGSLRDSAPELLGILVFVLPAVVLGGQIGPRVAQRLSRRRLASVAAALITLAGLVMIGRFL